MTHEYTQWKSGTGVVPPGFRLVSPMGTWVTLTLLWLHFMTVTCLTALHDPIEYSGYFLSGFKGDQITVPKALFINKVHLSS